MVIKAFVLLSKLNKAPLLPNYPSSSQLVPTSQQVKQRLRSPVTVRKSFLRPSLTLSIPSHLFLRSPPLSQLHPFLLALPRLISLPPHPLSPPPLSNLSWSLPLLSHPHPQLLLLLILHQEAFLSLLLQLEQEEEECCCFVSQSSLLFDQDVRELKQERRGCIPWRIMLLNSQVQMRVRRRSKMIHLRL